jgi:diguanylate cyclase (GGDEF)-like protein
MLENLSKLMDTSGFMPHGHCFLWTPGLLWTYVASDTAIGLAYYSIPIALTYFVRKRQDFSFNWIFLMFAAFIFACGTTHFMSVWNIWHPDYWVDASIKFATAALSMATAAFVWPLIPKALALPSHDEMQTLNRALAEEIVVRRKAEAELKALAVELEQRVQQRTVELEEANRKLQEQIAERNTAEEKLQRANAELERTVQRLAQRSVETSAVRELGDMLQSCTSASEGGQLIARYTQRLIPGQGGMLFVRDAQNDVYHAVEAWGDAPAQQMITAEDCWALRRGKAHIVKEDASNVVCDHSPRAPLFSVCVPLSARGEVLGLLTVHGNDLPREDRDYQLEVITQLTERIADRASLALADIKLRDSLRTQAIEDPLTGLYNRRFMEAAVLREITRARRDNEPIGVVMIDIDRFKKFNDTYGHQAGDEMMREVGRVIRSHVRAGDLACRYGGEEFVIILHKAPGEVSRQRAEQLRSAIGSLHFAQGSERGQRVTVSIGVATFPENGASWEALLKAADEALYAAKQAGRNRVAWA